MKANFKLIGLVLLVFAVLAAFIVLPATAAPPAYPVGAQTIYDSGWVLTTTGRQTFFHNLHNIPDLWSITCGTDPWGSGPTPSPTLFQYDGVAYGHLVLGLHPDSFEMFWYEGGIAHTRVGGWLQRGVAYCRFRVYAAD